MSNDSENPKNLDFFSKDFGIGLANFFDTSLRGHNNLLFTATIGLSSLDIGIPGTKEINGSEIPEVADITRQLINVDQTINGQWPNISSEHPFFELDSDNLTLFGTNLKEYFGELNHIFFDGPEIHPHLTPFYEDSVASELDLPDFPYGETAHIMHMVTAFYDTGRTFQDLWSDPDLKQNIVKIATHPHMVGAGIEHGVMLGVMGVLHPLGPLISLGVAHLAGNVVHTARLVAEGNKETIAKLDELPLLGEIFRISGLEAWAMSQKPVMGHHSHKIITSREQDSSKGINDIS
jgi:hypothetical protein